MTAESTDGPELPRALNMTTLYLRPAGDAELVLDQLESAIANYGIASVADLYDLAGITCRNYTANRYGWTDIQLAKVIRTREGYTLQLPRTVQIN